MEARKIKLGVDHPSTLTSLVNIAATYSSKDNATKLRSLKCSSWRLTRGSLEQITPIL
jgi:hypothetical protein